MPLAIGEANTWLIMIRRFGIDVLDGEDRAARQEADGDARAVGDLHEAKIVPAAASSGFPLTSSALLLPLNGLVTPPRPAFS